MKIFLVGEGPSDIGDLASAPQYRSSPPVDGFLQPLLRTMVQGPCEIDGQKITALRPRKVRGKKTAMKSKAAIAAAIAEIDEADLLVYSMDGDNDFADRRASLTAQLESIDIDWAIAMPKATIEAWAMGDVQAMKVLDGAVVAPSNPEALWGKPREPSSNHPKHVLKRVIGRDVDREDLGRIAAHALPSHLCTSCPDSFLPFAYEMSAATGHLPCTP